MNKDQNEMTSSKFKEIDGKMKLFYRLIISYQDFDQCYNFADLVLKEKLHYRNINLRGKSKYRIRILTEALNCAMIQAYCRPFSGNDKRVEGKITDLPNRFLRIYNKDEKQLHNILLEKRNKLLSHSDSDAWNLRPHYRNDAPGVLIPLTSATRIPLVREEVIKLKAMTIKQMKEVSKKRISLEKELSDFFITVVYDDEANVEETIHSRAYKEILNYIEKK